MQREVIGMKIVWLEKWWRIGPIGFWRIESTSCQGQNAEAILRRKSDILISLGLRAEDVDGKRFRWQVHDLPAVLQKASTA
jgi:hypothetical protein